VGTDSSYSDISQDSLCNTIREVLQVVPNAGETYIIGALRARGLRVQRWRVRAAIQTVDPISRSLRRTRAIVRRIYNVFSPNALW
jgi:5-carboxymethyl-2-hydroxymuconate isomerase